MWTPKRKIKNRYDLKSPIKNKIIEVVSNVKVNISSKTVQAQHARSIWSSSVASSGYNEIASQHISIRYESEIILKMKKEVLNLSLKIHTKTNSIIEGINNAKLFTKQELE